VQIVDVFPPSAEKVDLHMNVQIAHEKSVVVGMRLMLTKGFEKPVQRS